MTSKQVLIDTIQKHNPTATPEFLVTFDERALERYLSHLRHLAHPRRADQPWVRTPEAPAAVTRVRQ